MSGKSNGGTGNMRRHMENKHPNIILVKTVNEEGPFVSFELKSSANIAKLCQYNLISGILSRKVPQSTHEVGGNL